ncbi:MAG: hypothetical protein PHP25_00985 [Candidatus Moranbacteria bacterium]|nr:hypothetical protein [Candidatus Moranbacteria bacterium]
MNRLSYKVIKENENMQPICPIFQIVLDDKETGFYFDVAGLELSSKKSGIFPIVIGRCDVIGCCGMYIEVAQKQDKVFWKKFWNGQCCGEPEPDDELKEFRFADGFIIKPPLEFDIKEYHNIFEQIWKELPKFKSECEKYKRDLIDYKAGKLFRI